MKSFNAIGAVWQESGNVPLPEMATIQKTGMNDPLCAPGKTHIMSTAGLQVYNVTTQRQIYDLFNQKVAQYPELGDTWVLHEGYSVEAVRAVDPAVSAYALRDDYLLMYATNSHDLHNQVSSDMVTNCYLLGSMTGYSMLTSTQIPRLKTLCSDGLEKLETCGIPARPSDFQQLICHTLLAMSLSSRCTGMSHGA